mmetsp:Transcript_18974/g.53346  ORF Transcript_18974/g.53346 Transcript_18974/m.53346 type:complete len:225 (+) Transcript_18974:390-1064(+)
MPVPPGGKKYSGRCFFRTSSRSLSSRPSRYLSAGRCFGSGRGPSKSPSSHAVTTSRTHRSTQRSTNGAPGSKILPPPMGSNILCTASSRQPNALAAETATASADAQLRTSSNAATASLSAALCSEIWKLAHARLASSSAARSRKASPKRSPERFKASTPAAKASLAAAQSPRSTAASPEAFAESALEKNSAAMSSYVATVGTGASPAKIFQPAPGTTKASVWTP